MSPWNEREIARKLAERDELEPPAGLLEKIKGEIPPTIPVGVPRLETRRPTPPRQWLIAASLVAMVGAGLFALKVQKEAPSRAMTGSPARESAKDARVETPRALQPQLQDRRLTGPPLEVPPPPPHPSQKPLPKETERRLQALGYVSQDNRARQPEGAPGGVVGGSAGAPIPAAPPAPASASAAADAAPPQKAAEPAMQDFDAFEEMPVQVEKQAEGRINVGGNESGQQSGYVGPGHSEGPSFEEVSVHPVSIFRLGDDPVSTLDAAPPARARGDLAITAEGAPTPFVHGPLFRLLRFTGVPKGELVEVRFNPAAVERYRRLEGGAAALFEIELRSGAPNDGPVATLALRDHPSARRELRLSALAPAWEKASPEFRLAALAARFAEILKSARGFKGELAAIIRQVRDIGKELPGARAADLADRMEKAAGFRP